VAKYDPLRDRLRGSDPLVELSFEEISDLVGGLPVSAFRYEAWWANDRTHVQSAAWLGVGYHVEDLKIRARRVSFRRPESARD
jgi:hypothetical protein